MASDTSLQQDVPAGHVDRYGEKRDADIETVLRRHSNSGVSVAVGHGDVTPTGTVRNWRAFDLASHAAWGTPGVQRVSNQPTIAT